MEFETLSNYMLRGILARYATFTEESDTCSF
jgi:hypothetical protein